MDFRSVRWVAFTIKTNMNIMGSASNSAIQEHIESCVPPRNAPTSFCRDFVCFSDVFHAHLNHPCPTLLRYTSHYVQGMGLPFATCGFRPEVWPHIGQRNLLLHLLDQLVQVPAALLGIFQAVLLPHAGKILPCPRPVIDLTSRRFNLCQQRHPDIVHLDTG